MTNIPDIQERIKTDFGVQAQEAFEHINAGVASARHLNDPRIIRCIIFLADRDIKKLTILIDSAKIDPRDIIMWAEYIQSGPGDQTTRVRDFSKTFDQSETDVRE
ncbi:MAG: hypothetical protein H0U95_04950 [Bacteroidetes bacterium]|nr:hypothetical protein [Bacteroidota bacterium]